MRPQAKPVRLSKHAREQCAERGTTEDEVVQAVRHGTREPAKRGRWLYRYNVSFGRTWAGNFYAVKQVAPVVAEQPNEIVVVTVYTLYF